MIAKILNYFDIGLPNLTYKSPNSSQEFSHHTLSNMNYFWVSYLRLSKHGKKVYNFYDHVKCVDDAAEGHMDDEKPMGVHYDVTEGDDVMHEAPYRDDHCVGFGINFADIASIMIMVLKMKMRQDKRYAEECKW